QYFCGSPADVVTNLTPWSMTNFTMSGSRTKACAIFTPNGFFVRPRIFWISMRTSSSRPDDVSMMPMPPAFDTAEASWARAIQPMGAWTMGYSTPSISVMRFSIGFDMRFPCCSFREPSPRLFAKANWPEERPMPKLNRDGVDIYYEVHGQGPVILLTHGYSATAQMWKGQIAPFSKNHTLVVWDMRGHGQSDYPQDQSHYSEEATVADMLALLDKIGARTAIVGGLSLGGYMSLAFYRAHPERVSSLLIIDTGPGFKNDEAREAWNKYARETADRFEQQGLAPLQSASRERSTAAHRSADGLVR